MLFAGSLILFFVIVKFFVRMIAATIFEEWFKAKANSCRENRKESEVLRELH